MKISVIGTGYVGLVSGTCFAEMGNDVICVDVDEKKVASLKKGVVPIYEPGLETMVMENYNKKTLSFTTDIKEALESSGICFIAVGTPMGEDGSADLQYVLAVAKSIGEHMHHHMFVIDKSTVPVGTADEVAETIQNELNLRGSDLTFDVISNPEFMAEGTAVDDLQNPDRVLIGAMETERGRKAMSQIVDIYSHWVPEEKIITTNVWSSELSKLVANAM